MEKQKKAQIATLAAARRDLHAHSDAVRAAHNRRYFKTGKGEYSEDDIFIGVKMPLIRKIAKRYQTLSFNDIKALLYGKVHEERHLALLILVQQAKKQEAVFDFYITHINQVNNWDLVDTSAPHIVGSYLYKRKNQAIKLLPKLAKAKNMWHRRIAMVATQFFIQQGETTIAMQIATLLRNDTEDLIHKAVGWMLREVGKKNKLTLKTFLDQYAASIPRTMLRYALEHFEPMERKYYMGLKEQEKNNTRS